MLDFPASPSTGQIFQNWQFDSVKWKQLGSVVPLPVTDVGRNLLHNGTFDVWQRGPGSWTTTGTNVYTADRWKYYASLDTVSFAQTNLSDANRAAIGDERANFALYNSFTGNAGAAANTYVQQNIEGVRRLAGKTVTLSFYAAASAALKFGASIAQLFGTGGSPSAGLYPNGQSVTLATTPARYSLTFSIPSIAGKTLGTNGDDSTLLMLWYSSGATNNALSGGVGVQTGAIWLWGVQLEIGSVATALDVGGTPQQVLAECQRFFQTGGAGSIGSAPSAGGRWSTQISYPVVMRASPTVALANQSYSNASGAAVYATNAGYLSVTANMTAVGDAAVTFNYTASADL